MSRFCSEDDDAAVDHGLDAAQVLAREFAGLLATAEALARGGRAIELSGTEGICGRLCAAALDLPPDLGRRFRPKLAHLLEHVERVAMVLQPGPEQ